VGAATGPGRFAAPVQDSAADYPAVPAQPEQAEAAKAPVAYAVKTGESAGSGLAVQLVGLLCFLFFPFGIIVGLLLLILGGCMARKMVCSNCGTKAGKYGHVCPACKAHFLTHREVKARLKGLRKQPA